MREVSLTKCRSFWYEDNRIYGFGTVMGAVSCAVDIQRDFKRRGEDLQRKLQFRIGINLGDVIVDRNEIYGDEVNVAVRLQGLAEPGGICMSSAVHNAIGTKLPLTYEFMGKQSLKNIARPIRAFRVRPALEAADTPVRPNTVSRPWQMAALALLGNIWARRRLALAVRRASS